MAILEEHPLLLEAIREKRCALFLGAGVSSYDPNGLPTGAKLARDLALRGRLCALRECKWYSENECSQGECCWPLQRIAQYYEDKEGHESLTRYIEQVFAQVQKPLRAHRIIAELYRYFPKIITTNYDRLLENTYPEERFEVLTRDKTRMSKDAPVCIIKMHGCISKSKDIVITEDDYYQQIHFLGEDSLMADRLRTYLREYTVIFIGYSLEDSTFRVFYNGIRKYLGPFQKRAYAIQNTVDPLERRYWEKRHNVEILEGDLLKFLEEVNEWVNSDLEKARRKISEGLEVWQANKDILLTIGDYQLINSQRETLLDEIGDDAKELMLRSGMALFYDESKFMHWIDELREKGQAASVARSSLGSDRAYARRNSIKLLSKLGFTEADLPQLFKSLKDSNLDVRIAASEAIIDLDLRPETCLNSLFDRLKECIHEKRPEEISRFIVTTLCRLKPPDEVARLFGARLTAEEEVVQAAILEHFRGVTVGCVSECVAEAFKLGVVVNRAIGILATKGDNTAVATLEQVGMDAQSPMRMLATGYLGDIRTTRAVKALEKILQDEEQRIREEAVYALSKIVLADSTRATGGAYAEAERARYSAEQVLMSVSELPSVRMHALKSALGDLGADEAARVLALEGLTDLCPNDELLPILKTRLADDCESVQLSAARILASSFGVESLTESLRSLIKNWVFGVVTNIVLETDIYREGDKYAYVKALYDDVKTIQEDQSAKGKMSRELQKELRGLQEELRGLQEALVMKEE
jgi:HEAT repeat protein